MLAQDACLRGMTALWTKEMKDMNHMRASTASNTHFDDMESNAFEYFHSAIVENHDNYMQAEVRIRSCCTDCQKVCRFCPGIMTVCVQALMRCFVCCDMRS